MENPPRGRKQEETWESIGRTLPVAVEVVMEVGLNEKEEKKAEDPPGRSRV